MLISPLSNNILAAIHRQKCCCWQFGIQVRCCENLVESKIQEPILKRPTHAQAADSSTVIPATDLETAPCLVDRATALFSLGLATSIIYQGSWEESHPPMCQVIGPQTSVLALDPEVSQPFWSKSSGKPSKLGPNVSSEVLYLAPTQLNCVSGGDPIS